MTLKLEDIHTKKLKIVFSWMLGKMSLVIEWWMHGMSCLSMLVDAETVNSLKARLD